MSIMRITLLLIVGIVAIARAAPAPLDNEEPVAIIKQTQDGPNPDGSYSFSYETGNGIQAEESGSLVPSSDSKDQYISVKGSYSYIGEDGNPIKVTYIADENGFQPQGSHLPVAPEIPIGILKGLEWIAAHPEEDNL